MSHRRVRRHRHEARKCELQLAWELQKLCDLPGPRLGGDGSCWKFPGLDETTFQTRQAGLVNDADSWGPLVEALVKSEGDCV